MLQIKEISKTFNPGTLNEKKALRSLSLTLADGDFVTVIGGNGAGKSTLLRCINHLETPTSGKILFHGDEVKNTQSSLTKYRSQVGMVFQSFNLFNNMTVLKNCMFGVQKILHLSKEEAKLRAIKHLREVGMAAYINAHPAQLSGGQKQRVAIAGIVAMKPKCIVLDEPTAMLDPLGRKEVLNVLHELNRKENVTIILITHYMEEVVDADKIFVMDHGKVVMEGTPKEIFSRVDELKSYRLDVPQVTILADELRKRGLDIPKGILRKEELVEAITHLQQ